MRRSHRVLGFAALTFIVAGCWPVPGQNPDNTNHNPFENGLEGNIHQVWSWSGSSPGPAEVSAPVLSTAGVHVTQGCSVFTLNQATGAELWSEMVAPSPAACDAPIGGDMSEPFVVDSGDGPRVMASYGVITASGLARPWEYTTGLFDAATGEPRGSAPVGFIDSLRSNVLVGVTQHEEDLLDTNRMQIGTLDRSGRGFVTGVASQSGPPLGAPGFTTTGTDKVFHSGFGIMATTPGDSTQGYGLRAFSKTEARPGCGPVVTGHPRIPSVEVECPLWVNPLDGTAATSTVIYPGGTTLYVVTEGGSLYVVNAVDGTTQWTASDAGGRPALAGYQLFVPSDDGRILGFFASGCGAPTCPPDWVLRTPSAVEVSTPAVAGGLVWATQGGIIYAWLESDRCDPGMFCLPRWAAQTGAASLSSPVVSNGRLYVSTGSELLAYGN